MNRPHTRLLALQAQNKAAGKMTDKAKDGKVSAKSEEELKKKKGKEPEFFTAKTAPDQKADSAKK